MQIGELDRRVVIERPTEATNSYGERETAWGTYLEVWAKIDWKGGKRNEESQKLTAISNVLFFIRNLGVTVNETMRINYDSKYYYIHVINEIEGREKFLELITKEKD